MPVWFESDQLNICNIIANIAFWIKTPSIDFLINVCDNMYVQQILPADFKFVN